jgi:hypothetical protein
MKKSEDPEGEERPMARRQRRRTGSPMMHGQGGGGGGLLSPWFSSGGHPLAEMGSMMKQLEHMLDFVDSPILGSLMTAETMKPSVDIVEVLLLKDS